MAELWIKNLFLKLISRNKFIYISHFSKSLTRHFLSANTRPAGAGLIRSSLRDLSMSSAPKAGSDKTSSRAADVAERNRLDEILKSEKVDKICLVV